MANVHPWFANTTIDDAAGWTALFFEETNIAQADALSNKPKMYIAETGWPTVSTVSPQAHSFHISVINLLI